MWRATLVADEDIEQGKSAAEEADASQLPLLLT